MRVVMVVWFFVSFLLVPSRCWSGELARLDPAGERLPLLNGRLTAQFPKGARIEAPSRGMMAADPALDLETRVVIDAKAERLVVMAHELLQSAGEDFEKTVRANAPSLESEFGRLRLEVVRGKNASLTVIRFVPETPAPQGSTVFVQGAFVRNADATVQQITCFVNSEGAQDLEGVRQITDRIIESLEAGHRKLERKARTVQISGGEKSALQLKLPDDFVVTQEQGPDFQVYRVRKIVPLGESSGSLGIYLGHHPTSRLPQVTEAAGTILNKRVRWKQWVSNGRLEQEGFHEEVIVEHPKVKDLVIHMFIHAASESERELFRQIAESLRFGPIQDAGGATISSSKFTHVVSVETVYYRGGPQQTGPPDGKLQAGTKVIVLQETGTYSRVWTETGIEAFVATDSLKALPR